MTVTIAASNYPYGQLAFPIAQDAVSMGSYYSVQAMRSYGTFGVVQ